jgi:hypothetical protein
MGDTKTGLPVSLRLPLLILGFASLLSAIFGGLVRLGWNLPLPSPQALALHGPLMICGFFGTVIGLERAVALGGRWAYLGPLLSGIGGILILSGQDWRLGAWALTGASLVLLAASLVVIRRQQALFTYSLALGAASWLVGNLLWLNGSPTALTVAFWANFLIITIAAERLELSRFLPPSPRAQHLFVLILLLVLAGSLAVYLQRLEIIHGLGLIALALWLLRQDIARRTIRDQGLTRFVAVCLLLGYAWLAVSGLLMLLHGGLHGPGYDAILHSLFLGFVFSMVFGHAPIIFPAVLRVRMPWHWSFYLPLLVLQLSLLLRLTGSGLGDAELLRLGGLANAIALALFILSNLASVVRGLREPS